MASVRVTEADLLDALAAATSGEGPEGARTVVEIVEETGIHINRVRAALKAMQVAGRLQVHRARRADMSGRVQTVPAYTVTPDIGRGPRLGRSRERAAGRG